MNHSPTTEILGSFQHSHHPEGQNLSFRGSKTRELEGSTEGRTPNDTSRARQKLWMYGGWNAIYFKKVSVHLSCTPGKQLNVTLRKYKIIQILCALLVPMLVLACVRRQGHNHSTHCSSGSPLPLFTNGKCHGHLVCSVLSSKHKHQMFE